jgi:hypothetical protein
VVDTPFSSTAEGGIRSMTDSFPDPTRREARALILGTGTFWGLWALAVGGIAAGNPSATAVAAVLALIAGTWLYFGGVYSVAARSLGETVGQWYFAPFSRGWVTTFKGRSGRGWWRVIMPSYYRRAARALVWNENAVLVVLGTLLLIDLALFVWLWIAVPSQRRS